MSELVVYVDHPILGRRRSLSLEQVAALSRPRVQYERTEHPVNAASGMLDAVRLYTVDGCLIDGEALSIVGFRKTSAQAEDEAAEALSDIAQMVSHYYHAFRGPRVGAVEARDNGSQGLSSDQRVMMDRVLADRG